MLESKLFLIHLEEELYGKYLLQYKKRTILYIKKPQLFNYQIVEVYFCGDGGTRTLVQTSNYIIFYMLSFYLILDLKPTKNDLL